MDHFFRWESMPDEPHRSNNTAAHHITRKFVVGKNQIACWFTFKNAMTMQSHRHPHEQLSLIQRGRFRFRVAGDEREVGPGDVILIPGNVEHGFDVLEPGSVDLQIFSPVREDFLAT